MMRPRCRRRSRATYGVGKRHSPARRRPWSGWRMRRRILAGQGLEDMKQGTIRFLPAEEAVR